MTFKEKFVYLCNQKGEAPTFVCRQVGLSNAAYSCWTDESVPRRATLQRIADYFGVSVDYLLGKTEQKEKPTAEGGLEKNTVRFLGRDGKVIEKKLTPELLAYIESIPDSDDNL